MPDILNYSAEEYIKLFDKSRCKTSRVVGYCNNLIHQGFISVSLLKSHECIEKKCPWFKPQNPHYWAQVEKEREIKKKRREKAKLARLQEAARNAYIRSVFEPYDHIYVTSIQKLKHGLMITYIFNKRIDLSEPIAMLREKYKCTIYLKSVYSRKEVREALIGQIAPDTKTDLQTIPGVGKKTKQRLENVGYHCAEDLIGHNPEDIYDRACAFQECTVNKRFLYICRLAVAYAEAKIKDLG